MRSFYVALVDVVYWPVVQLSVSAILVRVPTRRFSSDSWITRARKWERSLVLYRTLGVPLWKKRLPDAGFLVGGARKQVNPYSHSDVLRFLSELRRAEVAHWLQLTFAIFCWFWNPIWSAIAMTLYAISTNTPCIAVQRYNRILVLSRSARK